MGGTPNSYDITSEKLFYTKQSKAKYVVFPQEKILIAH